MKIQLSLALLYFYAAFMWSAWASDCEYALDGVDDSASFHIGVLRSSPTFTISLWFRNNKKERNSHIAQSIFAVKSNKANQHSWFGLFWQPDSKLQLDLASVNLVCDVDVTLQSHRWYHVAITGGMDRNLQIWINGIDMKVSCFKDKETVTETIVAAKNLNLHNTVSMSKVIIGSHVTYNDLHFKGSVVDIRFYGNRLDGSDLYQEMFNTEQGNRDHHTALQVQQSLIAPCEGSSMISSGTGGQSDTAKDLSISNKPKIRKALSLDPDKQRQSALASRAGIEPMLHINGSPELKDLNFGDGYLSVMLSLVEAKLVLVTVWENSGQGLPPDASAFFQSHFGDISRMVPDTKLMLLKLRQSLTRHFNALIDEEYVWRSYNEYAVRLEMLGHSLALLLKQQTAKMSPAAPPTDTTSGPSEKMGKNKPVVAVIAPATSKGIDPHKLDRLAIALSLLPSLYATRSQNYDYRVYISANENDIIFSNEILLAALFDGVYARAKEMFYKSVDPTAAFVPFPKIHHRLVVVPSSMIPKRALSALFNIPTLMAYEDGCDYFYIGNDDLQFQSKGWTELLVDPLMNNPVYPGLGVSGGIDISDSITPQIEFPFFHRTHVELFPWCGTNPWIFKNWWEDNWLTDIYLPFDSIFYRKGVIVENYVGLENNDVTARPEVRAADPRYEVEEGRRTPPYYVEEVERARERILEFLLHEQNTREDRTRICETRDYCPHGTSLTDRGRHSDAEPRRYSGVTNMSYCFNVAQKTPTLASMPIHIHEEALDPCNSGIGEGSSLKKYRYHVHAKELPHASYAPLVPCKISGGSSDSTSRNADIRKVGDIVQVCSDFYAAHKDNRSPLEDMRVGHMSDEMYHSWMACMSNIGLGHAVKATSLSKGELCRKQTSAGADISPYASCMMTIPLKILILHNHCPLFTRYGSDKRLYHIAETLVGLGHHVTFGGAFKSDLESDDDHNRLKAIDAKLYSPLAMTLSDGTVVSNRGAYEQLLRSLKPDFVLMTMWFWNIPPAMELFYSITRHTLSEHARIGVLSDDAHSYREQKILQAKGDAGGLVSMEDVNRGAYILRTENQGYSLADVVMTITEDDKMHMLAPAVLFKPVFQKGSSLAAKKAEMMQKTQNIAPLDESKFQVVRYALSPTEILSETGLRLRGESGGNLDGSIRAHLSFVGNGANPTNKQALHWFFSDVFPLIVAKHPDMRVVIIGADWEYLKEDFPQYKDFALVIRGILNQEDMTSAMLTTKVFISPIVASTGLNTKNLLALSRGLPMVTTPDGSHGLKYSFKAPNREGTPPFFVAVSAVEFADAVLLLYSDNVLWKETALASLQHARTEFGLSAQAHEIENAIQIAFSTPSKRGGVSEDIRKSS